MNIYDKLTLLESMHGLPSLSGNNQQLIFEMCSDQSDEVRMRAAELLGEFPSDDVANMLCSMLKDSDELVRATVCESLGYCDLDDHIESVIHCTKDKSPLVRGYAVLSLADFQYNYKQIHNQLNELFTSLLEQEKDEWVKIALLRSLIVLGNNHYFEPFFMLLRTADYPNQCFALSLLNEMQEDDVISLSPYLRNELLNISSNSSSLVVKDKISKLLS